MKHTPEPWSEPDANHCGTRLIPLADYQRARICINACAGIENPEEAIREAISAIKNIISVGLEYYDMDMGDNGMEAIAFCESALAKLQPKQAE